MAKNPFDEGDGGVDADGGVQGDVVVDDIVGEEGAQRLGVVLGEGVAHLPHDPLGILCRFHDYSSSCETNPSTKNLTHVRGRSIELRL
jgi:hypothetical protein